MKKVLILISILFIAFTNNLYAQVSQTIKSKIDIELSRELGSEYKGNICLTDEKQTDTKTYIVIGTFDLFHSTTHQIYKKEFKAMLKIVFDEVEVIELIYKHWVGGAVYYAVGDEYNPKLKINFETLD